MAIHIALLRGVNLGSHRRVAMADVRGALAAEGFDGVATHLQSGNVVLRSPLAPTEVGRTIERSLAERLGLTTTVIVRSPEELAAAIDADPFRAIATDPARHVLGFLSAAPEPRARADVERIIAGLPADGDRHAFAGAHFYLWCPNGISSSPYFKVRWDLLGVGVTQRNRNRATALLRIADGPD